MLAIFTLFKSAQPLSYEPEQNKSGFVKDFDEDEANKTLVRKPHVYPHVYLDFVVNQRYY